VASIALRALGISLRLQLRLEEAVATLGRAALAAVAYEDDTGDTQPLADVLLSRAFVHALTGNGEAAEIDLADAERRLPVAQHPTLWMQRAGVLGLLGRDLEALGPATRAVERHRRRGESLELGRALQTRAARQQSLGRLDAAERDSQGAIRAYERVGNRAGAAMCRYNLAAITACRGDLPTALRGFDAAETELASLGIDVALGAEGRLEALLRSRLFGDALPSLRRCARRSPCCRRPACIDRSS
jgi:tetratricopeptide (TPR) repeat protein